MDVFRSARGYTLQLTDGEQSPCDRGGTSSITLLGSESVGSGGTLEEDESEENESLGPETSLVLVNIDAESLESGEDDKNDSPWRDQFVSC